MGNGDSVPKEVIDFPSDKTKVFNLRFEHCGSWGMEGVYKYALQCIKTAYPNAIDTRNYSPSRGQFQIFVKDKDGTEKEVYNKHAKDGSFSEKTAIVAVERIKKIVEG